MLTRKQLEFLWEMENILHRCIRAGKYFEAVTGASTNLWAFTQNCYGEICIVYWCKIFGGHGEPTHYSRLFERSKSISLSEQDVSEKLRKSVGLNPTEYDQLWKKVKACRDRFFVHYDSGVKPPPVFPDLAQLVKISMEIRDILSEILTSEESKDREYQENLRYHFQCNTNESILEEFKEDMAQLRVASGTES